MGNRSWDWLTQADHDLRHAEHALEDGDYDWACFAAHQAAKKAVKAAFLAMGEEGWGHSITRLLCDLNQQVQIPDALLRAAQRLDKHYSQPAILTVLTQAPRSITTPCSDADIAVEIAEEDPALRDAVREQAIAVFAEAPVPAEVFVKSAREREEGRRTGRGIAGAVAREGLRLA